MSLRINSLVVMSALFAAGLNGCAVQAPPPPRAEVVVRAPDRHPAYLHALSDLRAARWMIEHRPGDWARTVHEVEAVRQIDAALSEIQHAAYDDGKNLNDHPPVDERPEHRGRLHEAAEFLGRARGDIAREEDNGYAQGLRDRALSHIDAALRETRVAEME